MEAVAGLSNEDFVADGEIGFTEVAASGRLRHPRFLGLRRDKAAKEVARETAEA